MQDSQRNSSRDSVATTGGTRQLSDFSVAYELPVREFVRWAYEHYFEFTDGDEWQSPLWSFVRLLKGHPELIGQESNGALQVIDRTVKGWMGRGGGDAWEHFFEIPREDAEVEFMGCWEKVRFVPGWEPMHQAVERAKKTQLIPPIERTAGYQNFVSIAGWLQVTMGDRNIMLPCEKLGRLLGCKPMTISRYRRWAIEDGLIAQVKEHRFKPGGGGDATEFRFDTSRYKCLDQTAQKAS